MPVPYCLDDCGFVVETEVRQVDTSSRELNSANNLNELDADPSPELPKSHAALIHLDFVFVKPGAENQDKQCCIQISNCEIIIGYCFKPLKL